LLSFIAAFNKAPVARLKHTKEALGSVYLKVGEKSLPEESGSMVLGA
jgi:hypothetical protein